jgi:hypothetical protein
MVAGAAAGTVSAVVCATAVWLGDGAAEAVSPGAGEAGVAGAVPEGAVPEGAAVLAGVPGWPG